MIEIRHMLTSDLDALLEIETNSFSDPWSVDDFKCCLRRRRMHAMVITFDSTVAGFVIYEFSRNSRTLFNFAIEPTFRGRGFGSQLLEKILQTTRPGGRVQIILKETNLHMQLFVRRFGFRAVEVLHHHYADLGEDGYRMVWTRPENVAKTSNDQTKI